MAWAAAQVDAALAVHAGAFDRLPERRWTCKLKPVAMGLDGNPGGGPV